MKFDLKKDLLAFRIKLELYKRDADTFEEEVVLNSIAHSVGEALDILNNKKPLLQGPKETRDTDGDDRQREGSIER